MKVLVVEDDPNLRALWGTVFQRVGHVTRLEESEAGARAALTEEGFDLFLLDLYLASDRSIDLNAMSKLLQPDAKIVVITGTSAYSKGELFGMAPAVAAVLRKPVDIEDLVAVCEHIDNGMGTLPAVIRESATVEFRS